MATPKEDATAINTRCKPCGVEGHSKDSCESDTLNCYHCSGEHEAQNICSRQQSETQIIAIQEQFKVGRRRAVLIISGETNIETIGTDHYVKHFTLKFDSQDT